MDETTREQLRRLGISPRKGLGQHFLINEPAADRIVEAALECEPDGVVEIGAGLGMLTRRLAMYDIRLVAIERDESMRPELERYEQWAADVEIVIEDVLEVDLSRYTADGRWAAVGNIPYQITSPLLEKLLTTEPPFASIVLMIQREVAARLAAEPGTSEYGALTLLARFYAGMPEVIAELSPGSFVPPPKVHSTVLRFTPRTPPVEDPALRALLFDVVKAAFGQRRKQLPNALSGAPHLSLERQQAREALVAAGIRPRRRGETLSLEEFVALTEAVAEVG